MKIFAIERRLQKGFGSAEPFPILDRCLQMRKAEVVLAVDVQDLVTAVVDRVEEGVGQWRLIRRRADGQQPSGRVVSRVFGHLHVLLIFRFFEKWQDILVAPARVSLSVPLVEVFLAASDVEHPVDHGRPAYHLAAVPGARVPVHGQARSAVGFCSEKFNLNSA